MANTYTQCYFHLVFAVKNRDALIKKEWKAEMEMYITGIVQNHRHKMLAIASMPDHMHILIGYNVNQLIPDLVEEIKTSSNSWIKGKRTMLNSTRNTCLNFLVIFMNGIKYYGALHLWNYFSNTFLQIFRSSAAMYKA
jgi:REP element-mobilizing transposase RayT